MNATRVPSAESAEADAERQPDQLAPLDGRGLQRVGQVGRDGLALNLGERPSWRSWMEISSGMNFFWYSTAPMPIARIDRPNVSPYSGVARSYHQWPGVVLALVLPRPEQEDHQQRQARKTAQQKPVRDRALGALLGLGALDRPAVVLVDGLDAVDLAAEFDQFLARHRRQFGVAGLARLAAVARDVCALARRRSCPCSDPQRRADDGDDADDPDRPCPRRRAEAAEAVAAGVRALRSPSGRRRRCRASPRARAGGRRTWACSAGRSASRCRSARARRWPRSGAYLPDDSAPPLPVKLWHDAQFSRNRSPPRATSLPISECLRDLAVVVARDGRAAAVGLHVGAERVDLRLVELRWLARRLRLAAHGGHAAGGHLEVDGGLADADQAGAAVGHALQVRAVAGHARGVEQLLAGAQQRRLPTRRRRRPAGSASAWRPGHRRRRVRSAAAPPLTGAGAADGAGRRASGSEGSSSNPFSSSRLAHRTK